MENINSTQVQNNTEPEKTNFFIQKIKPLYNKLDLKLTSLVPDQKLRKIIIISTTGFFIFLALLLILGIIFSTARPKEEQSYTLNKPSITQNSPKPEKPNTKIQNELIELKGQLDNLKFPPSELTTPLIEVDIDVQ